jgi:hypothetical protein
MEKNDENSEKKPQNQPKRQDLQKGTPCSSTKLTIKWKATLGKHMISTQ